jgi:3-oxoacyl-[acyl-carrier protein] reductase
MPFALDLSGRVALVTGGSRGIGAAIVLALADAGADVAVNFRERADEAAKIAAAVRAKGRRAETMQADVSDRTEVTRMVAFVAEKLGPVDLLVNNAGVGLRRGIDDLTEADFDLTLAVNLKSAFLCTQAVLPHMRAQKFGRIVNISSGAARGAGGIGLHYNASKAGLEGLTRGYAARLYADGITVNAVAPSMVETDMVRQSLADRAAQMSRRLGQVDEIAHGVLMALTNAYMTGQTIQLNGGSNFI